MKAIRSRDTGHLVIQCPGCKTDHVIDSRWTFNGDLDRPTFKPSLLVRCNPPDHKDHRPEALSSVCHSFITDGKIQFLADSTHELARQTVELPEWSRARLMAWGVEESCR